MPENSKNVNNYSVAISELSLLMENLEFRQKMKFKAGNLLTPAQPF